MMTDSDIPQQMFLVAVLLLAQLLFLRNAFNVKKLGLPIYVMIIIYLFIATTGYIFYVFFPEVAYQEALKNAFIIRVTDQEALFTLLYFLYIVSTILFGAIIFSLVNTIFFSSKKDQNKVKMRSAKIPIPAASRRSITEFSLRVALPPNPSLRSKERGIDPQRLNRKRKTGLHYAQNGLQTNLSLSYGSAPLLELSESKPDLLLNRSKGTVKQGKKSKKAGIDFKFVFLLCVIVDAVFVTGCGFKNIFISDAYLNNEFPVLVTIGTLGLLCTSALLGYAMAESKQAFRSSMLLLLALVNILLMFSIASRRLGFIPILFATGYNFNSGHDKRISKIITVASAVLFMPLFGLPLYIRAGQYGHGMIPYFQALSEMDPSEILGITTIFKNVLFSFPLTYKVMEFRNSFDVSYFWTSVNPLPGNATNWYEINNNLRLNYFTPFNTIGEAYLYGDTVSFLFFFSIGFAVMYLSHVVERNASAKGGKVFGLIVVGLIAVFSIFSLQYNTRAAIRYLYWALLGSLVVRK